MSMSSGTTPFLSDVQTQMHIERALYADDKSFILGAEPSYPDVGESVRIGYTSE